MNIKVNSLDGIQVLNAQLPPLSRAEGPLPERARLQFLDALSSFLTRNPKALNGGQFTVNTDLNKASPELRKALCKIYNVGQYWLGKGSLDESQQANVIAQANKVKTVWDKAQTQRFCGFWPNFAEFVYTVPIDSNSLFRNTISAVDLGAGGIAALSATTTLSGVIAMPAIVYAGSKLAKQGLEARKRANEIGDTEGLFQAWTNIIGGTSYGTLGVGFAPAFLPDFLSLCSVNVGTVGAAVAQAGGFAVNGLGLILYAAVAASAIHGISYMNEFRNDFTDILYQQEQEDTEKASKALRFLKQQFTLTKADAQGLNDDAQKAKKAQEKWDRFERRVGKECAVEVQNKVDGLLESLKTDFMGSPRIDEAKALIEKVDRASFQAKVKQVLLLIIAIVGMTATILSILAMTIGTGGIAAAVLTALAALLWLTTDSSKFHVWTANQAAKVFLKKDYWTDKAESVEDFSLDLGPDEESAKLLPVDDSRPDAPTREWGDVRSIRLVDLPKKGDRISDYEPNPDRSDEFPLAPLHPTAEPFSLDLDDDDDEKVPEPVLLYPDDSVS